VKKVVAGLWRGRAYVRISLKRKSLSHDRQSTRYEGQARSRSRGIARKLRLTVTHVSARADDPGSQYESVGLALADAAVDTQIEGYKRYATVALAGYAADGTPVDIHLDVAEGLHQDPDTDLAMAICAVA
jgi:hypothetical protein